MNDRTRRLFARALIGCGLLLIGTVIGVLGGSSAFQAALARRLEGYGLSTRSRATLARAIMTRREAGASGLVGRIEIPSIGLSALIVEGDSEGSLLRGVGHVEGTAFPGEEGNVGLAGHRDTYFRKLERIAPGDHVVLHTPDGAFDYTVDSVLIVRPTRGDLLGRTQGSMLTLVTCYPFRWIGPAPRRFVVRASRADVARWSSPTLAARRAGG